jgi:hypothetical protein
MPRKHAAIRHILPQQDLALVYPHPRHPMTIIAALAILEAVTLKSATLKKRFAEREERNQASVP